ncbi:Nitrilase [Lachnellula hyalina]|uniref:nitrilase n=1 Tax=Lachnellula hyalina TaxID=1316788 RepID=A0A8H8TVP5_9HELO|nr:Nitrilase [Lachnellula hyalina]QVV41504.1 nitrilase [synthetic construct]TVY23592.1 Nitrilase [Lachnellula hyalina]
MAQTVRVGAVQAEPAWLDLQGGVEKTIALIQQAGKDGVNVLGFPEVWLTGYPWAIWTKSVVENTELIHQYMANSMAKVSPEMNRIRAACKEAGVFTVLGYSERDGASLYIAQSFISTEGEIVLHRRKIKPTHVERSIWGDGQADSLTSVVDTKFGKVGGLNCWEHLQPLLRYYEYCQGVQIHVAGWPPMFPLPDPKKIKWPYHETEIANQLCSQFLAIEGQAFVLVATQVLTEGNLEKLNLVDSGVCQTPGGGFTMIYGPDGKPLCEPWPPGKEGIMQADIDLKDIDYAKSMIDTVGHYSRPDLLSLNINSTAAKPFHFMKE